MKAIIEHNGKPAFLNAEHGYLRTEDFVSIRPGDLVQVCAWDDRDKAVTRHLESLGYNVSHGICETCKAGVVEQYEQTAR